MRMEKDAVLASVRLERPMVEHLRDLGLHVVDMHFHTKHAGAYTEVRAAVGPAKETGVGLVPCRTS